MALGDELQASCAKKVLLSEINGLMRQVQYLALPPQVPQIECQTKIHFESGDNRLLFSSGRYVRHRSGEDG